MECSLKYVMVIFITIYLLLEFFFENKENFSITMDDIISNPVKAGSIEYTGGEKDNPDFYQFMNADNIFRKNIRDETKYFQQIRKPVPGDYKPYEVILPDKFQVPQVKYVDTRKIFGVGKIEDEFKEIDYKINSRQVTMRDPNNDCQGEWSQWNEDNCYNPQKRCSLKYRRYNITKEKREQGLRCEYNGREIDDGDLDYDYCYGGNNEERCNYQGNLCECNLDDMDDPDSQCDVELNNMCVCPDDIELDANGRCSPPPPPEPEDSGAEDAEGVIPEGTEIYYGIIVYRGNAPSEEEFIDLLVGYLQGIKDDINRDSISNVNVRRISGTTTFTFTVTCINCSDIEIHIQDFERDQNDSEEHTPEELNIMCKNSAPIIDNTIRKYLDGLMKLEFNCNIGYISDNDNDNDSLNCVNGEWGSTEGICNLCDENFHVKSNKCIQCPSSSVVHPSGDNPMNDNTTCAGSPTPATPTTPATPATPATPYVPPTQEESRHDETLRETIRRNYIILFVSFTFIIIIILSMFVY